MVLNKLYMSNSKLVPTGDFNVDIRSKNTDGILLVSLLGSFGLICANKSETRGRSCLDNVATNYPPDNYTYTAFEYGISDQIALVLSVNMGESQCDQKTDKQCKRNITCKPITSEGFPDLRKFHYYTALKRKGICFGKTSLLKVCFFLCVLCCCFIASKIYLSFIEYKFYQLYIEHYGGKLVHTDKNCIIPNYHHLDPSILKYIIPWPPINCGEMQPYLTYLDKRGFIHLNESGIKESRIPKTDLQCHYKEIVRGINSDDLYELSPPLVFSSSEPVSSDFVIVKCYQISSACLVYETAHAHVPTPESKILKNVPSNQKVELKENMMTLKRPSVLVISFDSMSRLNFIRQMPRTYRFLTETLKVVVFKGLTTTGMNTFPNIIPMLAGKGVYKKDYIDDLSPGQKLRVPMLGGENARYGNFDDVPLVWKNFSNAGYITMFAEDLPEYSAFNYLAKGFLKQPTDYYMRPFWLVIDKLDNFQSPDMRCYSNTPKHTYLFNYTEEFITKMSNYSYFAFSFLTDLSHNSINSIKVIDDETEAYFRRMYSSGALNNTITIVMGDHGNRFDDIRISLIGRIEDRMPFFSISLPESLKKSHPHLYKGLISNTDTLMSWFDVYELLMDLAMDNLKEISQVKHWGVIGLSPFRTLPRNRTCYEAGIPHSYCVCSVEKDIDPGDSHAVEAAETLVTYLNTLLKVAGVNDKCAELKVVKVLSVQILLHSALVISQSGLVLQTRVSIETVPGGAQLEGVLEKDAWSENGGRVVGNVNRINRYGNQSYCVNDVFQKLFCFCKSFLNQIT